MTRGQLFSEYFLQEGTKSTEDYQSLSADEVAETYNEIRGLYHAFHGRASADEADTEDEFVRPLLEKLGFFFSRQKSPSGKGRQDVPDFLLFSTQAEKDDFGRAPKDGKPWNKGICILEGKKWNRALDRGDRTDPVDQRVPSNQILRYMSTVEVASNGKILWGVLTNGRLWRLYYHLFPTRSQGYLQVDLGLVFDEASDLFAGTRTEEQRVELFKLFYLLFRREAFIRADWRPHTTFLELALDEGKKWEERVAEDLRNNIFGEVFPLLAQGFVRAASESGMRIDDTLLDTIYENALVFLYRLLFVSHAEDRNLLPASDPRYEGYSLSKLRDELAERIDSGASLSETAKTCWDRLRNLFTIVNAGDRSLGVSPYNGGLFEPESHPFLEQFWITDRFLVPALDMVSRDYGASPPKRINYRDLSVRQLGSIYEGLLEFRLKVAGTHLKVTRMRGREVYRPADSESEATIKKGDIYLTNDKLERRATGSYYTPDYVVEYIVKNTVGPLVDHKIEEFRGWIVKVKSMQKQQFVKKLAEHKIRFDPKTYSKHGHMKGRKPQAAYKTKLLEIKDPANSILDLKILDPAMGSGHFIVGAVDYLAERLRDVLADYSGVTYFGTINYESPLVSRIQEMREAILTRTEQEGCRVDESELGDENLLKRIILKRCVYGVDVNPLAVELAKVALWLHTFTLGAPLSFLDHHLRCGNSLLGVWQISEAIVPSSERYQDFLVAVKNLALIQGLYDLTINETVESSTLYAECKKKLVPIDDRLNVSMAAKNFLKERDNVVNMLGQKALNKNYKLHKDLTKKYEQAKNLSAEKHFFHWRLEFPEIWYEEGKEKEDGGFDAVIGNPPYLVELRLNKETFRDLQLSPSVGKYYEAKMDIFYFFLELGIDLLRRDGYLGHIVQEYWMARAKAKILRTKIFRESTPKDFTFFKEYKVFREAMGQHNMTIVLQKNGRNGQEVRVASLSMSRLSERIEEIATATPAEEEVAKDRIAEKIVGDNLFTNKDGIFNVFQQAVATMYSPTTDRVYVSEAKLSPTLEQLKTNSSSNTLNLDSDELQEGVVTPQHTHRDSGEGVFVLSLREYEQVHWTSDEREILRPFYFARELERHCFPCAGSKYFLIYTPIDVALEIELHGVGAKLGHKEIADVWQLLRSYPHAQREFKKWLAEKRIDGSKADKNTLSQWLGMHDEKAFPNMLAHLEKYRPMITSSNAPFGIHRARQPEWFEDPRKIIGVRKTKRPKFVVVQPACYMDQSVFVVRLVKHESYSPYYFTALLNSKLAWWWFYQQKRQGEQLQIDKEVLVDFPIPEIQFGQGSEVQPLRSLCENGEFDKIKKQLTERSQNTVLFHDLLSFLAQTITERNTIKDLLGLFLDDKLEEGSDHKIEVLNTLRSRVEKLPSDVILQKELCKKLLREYEDYISKTEDIIDSAVYQLYQLSEKEVEIIEEFCRNRGAA